MTPEPYEEMHCRIAYAKAKKRCAVKRAAIWRKACRIGRGSGFHLCQRERQLAWEDVRYWVLAGLEARGR